MTEDVDKVIDNLVLAHRADYDPVAARAYYLRTRKLKGRTPATPTGPRKQGKKRVEEDEVPEKSPNGSALVDYRGGRAVYKDGSMFDGDGWHKPGWNKSNDARKARAKAAQSKLDRVKRAAKKASPEKRKSLEKRISAVQAKLNRLID